MATTTRKDQVHSMEAKMRKEKIGMSSKPRPREVSSRMTPISVGNQLTSLADERRKEPGGDDSDDGGKKKNRR